MKETTDTKELMEAVEAASPAAVNEPAVEAVSEAAAIDAAVEAPAVEAVKDEAVENFVKSKREELEKMVPDFVDDRKFTDIVLNFYERGIRDCAQMMLERMTENAVNGICISNGTECGATIQSSAGILFLQHNTLNVGDKVKIIIIRRTDR